MFKLHTLHKLDWQIVFSQSKDPSFQGTFSITHHPF